MSIGTWTWEDKDRNLCFLLIKLNFQLLESNQTSQHTHTNAHTGHGIAAGQRGAAQGHAASHLGPPMMVPCQLGGSVQQASGGPAWLLQNFPPVLGLTAFVQQTPRP